MMTQVLLLSTLSLLVPVLDPYLSNRGLARTLSSRAKPEEGIVVYGVSYENMVQTLPFYLKRRVGVLGDPGELQMGLSQSSDAGEWFAAEAGAEEALAKKPVGTWVVTNEEYAKRLGQTELADAFEPAGREGRMLLLHKVR